MAKVGSGIKIDDVEIGTGAMAKQGKQAIVHYRGFLNESEQFRSTYEDGQPISFAIGKRQVVAGLEQGVEGMRVGGRRRIEVSPHLAYGTERLPGIPPNAVVTFEVELVDVQD